MTATVLDGKLARDEIFADLRVRVEAPCEQGVIPGAAHVTAAEATDEVAQLVQAARRVAYPNPVRRVSIGPCVEVGCAGDLVAFVYPRDTVG